MTSPVTPFLSPYVEEVEHADLGVVTCATFQPPAGDVHTPSPAELPSFTVALDAWSEECVFTFDPARPVQLLARHQLPLDDDGDRLWALIVAAVGAS